MTSQLYARVETKSEVWIVGRQGLFRIFQFLMRWLLRYRQVGNGEELKWVSSVWIIQTSRNTYTLNRTLTSLTPSISALPSQTSFSRVYKKEDLSHCASMANNTGPLMPEPSGKPSCGAPGTGQSPG